MTKQKTSLIVKSKEKIQKKPGWKQSIALEAESDSQERPSAERVDLDNKALYQPSQLSDKRLSTIHRQSQAIRLGKLLGNHYLQREMASLPDQEQPVEASPLESNEMDVQRMSIAMGPTTDADWKVVPPKHRGRVRAALAILNDWVANNTRLRTYFRHNAPGGTNATLQNVANRAQVWELRKEERLGLSVLGGSDMAYDTLIYRIGKWQIASTLLHEMGHLANIRDEKICEEALEAARAYCPFIESIVPRQGRVGDEVTIKGISFGPSQTADDKVEFNGVDAGMAVSWSWSDAGGEIKVRVPAGAATGPVCIINNNIRSNGVNFTVLP